MKRIGIVGYGNLGKGIECACKDANDMTLSAVFTRRPPETVTINTSGVPVCSVEELKNWEEKLDLLILCGGSATDLPEQTKAYVRHFHVVDSFDTHARIPEHFAAVDAAAKETGHVAVISVGWDPGMFSLNRLYARAILPDGKDETFWGKGVSQGHSDAIRRIPGVKNAKQYTIPIEEALQKVRSGEQPVLSARDKHLRECFVVLEEDADPQKVEETIKTMPNYFADYNTIVHFIDEDTFLAEHSGMSHGGFVIRSGKTGFEKEHQAVIEYRLQLDSNPEFTANVLVAYARAAFRIAKEGGSGCKTVFDIPPAYLLEQSSEECRKTML